MTEPAAGSNLLSLGDEKFVSLTTFRRSGQPVATPVWIARDGAVLVVTTPSESGKVKRLKHDRRVEVRPCDRRGRVEDGAATATGVAEVVTDPAEHDRLAHQIKTKYGFEYRAVMAIERVFRRQQRRRFILRISTG